MVRTVTITSGKGGVGKSNICLNLALQLGALGNKTCLFDADLGLANANILLGLYPSLTLEDVLIGNLNFSDIMITGRGGIDIVPGSSGVELLANLGSEQSSHLIESFALLNDYDYLLFDTSSGISENVMSFCLASDELIVVITPEPTSLVDAYALVKVLSLNGYKREVKILVNDCQSRQSAKNAYHRFKGAVSRYLTIDISPLGIIYHDPKLEEAVKNQKALIELFPDSIAAKCIKVIAKRLVENQKAEFENRDVVLFWSRYFENLNGRLDLGGQAAHLQEKTVEVPREATPSEESTTTRVNLAGPEADSEVEKPARDDSSDMREQIPQAESDEEDDTVTYDASEILRQAALDAALNKFDALPESFESTEPVIISRKPVKSSPVAGADDYDIMSFPSMPHVLSRLIQICGRPKAQTHDLSEIINLDPLLAVKVLMVSGISGSPTGSLISSMEQAVTILGAKSLNNIAMTESVQHAFGFEINQGFDFKEFWRHSLLCGTLARLIAESSGEAMGADAHLAGLLHDIGKLILWLKEPERYGSVLSAAGGDDELLVDIERQLGLMHWETGANVLSQWNIHPFITDAVRYHHESSSRLAEAFPLVRIVYAADKLSVQDKSDLKRNLVGISEFLGRPADELNSLVRQAEEELNRVSVSLGLESKADLPARDAEELRTELAGLVKSNSRLHGAVFHFLKAKNQNEVLSALASSLEIIFGVRNIICFLYDDIGGLITGSRAGTTRQAEMVSDLFFPLNSTVSLVSKSLLEKRVLNSFDSDTSPSIIDETILRILDCEGMLCLPMSIRKNCIGVVAAGVDERQCRRILEDAKLLDIFTALSSLSLSVKDTVEKRVVRDEESRGNVTAMAVITAAGESVDKVRSRLEAVKTKQSASGPENLDFDLMKAELDRISRFLEVLSDPHPNGNSYLDPSADRFK